jgi:trans-2,3-dihydro-3-hydroxyanthranilate isomerase
MQTEVHFAFVDVFAERPLTGNPLAVVPDADALDVEQMKALAREFNQSETTFILRPTAPPATWQLRSFTPAGVEVGGAGHNALGAWLWLAHAGKVDGEGPWRQQIGTEVSPVELSRQPGGQTQVVMYQTAPRFEVGSADQHALATALAIRVADLAGPAQVVSTGVGHLLIPVTTKRAVDAARPSPEVLAEVLRAVSGEGAYLYTTATGQPGTHAYARFFNPTVGISEDPATGTAAGPLAARLVRDGIVQDNSEVVILQGVALGRPSRIVIGIDGDSVRISGAGCVTGQGAMWI